MGEEQEVGKITDKEDEFSGRRGETRKDIRQVNKADCELPQKNGGGNHSILDPGGDVALCVVSDCYLVLESKNSIAEQSPDEEDNGHRCRRDCDCCILGLRIVLPQAEQQQFIVKRLSRPNVVHNSGRIKACEAHGFGDGTPRCGRGYTRHFRILYEDAKIFFNYNLELLQNLI